MSEDINDILGVVETKTPKSKTIDSDEEKLSNYAHNVLIAGKLLSFVIFIAGFIISGISHDFELIYFIIGIVIAAINLFSTFVLSAFLKVISNISTSLKNK